MERKLKELLPGGVFENVSDVRSRTMSAIKGKHTKSTERKLRMILVRSEIKGWKLHASNLPGKPDFYFPHKRFIIFVDGCFWHGCSRCGHIPKTNTTFWAAKINRNIERDKANRRSLKKLGLNVLRVWEHSLKSASATSKVINKIKSIVNQNPKAISITKSK